MELAQMIEIAAKMRDSLDHTKQAVGLLEGALALLEGAKPTKTVAKPTKTVAKPQIKLEAPKAPAAPKGWDGGWPKAQVPVGTTFQYTRKGNGKVVTFRVTGFAGGKVLAVRA